MDQALLQAPPSQHAWKQICDALDALEGRELDKAIAEVDAALEDWPDSQRYGNQWARSLAANGAEPRLRVARSLNLTGCRGSKTVIDSVAGSADIAHLKTLIFSLVPISPKKMKILAASPHLAGVEMMRFSMCYMKDTGFSHFSKSTTIQSLRRLEVGNNELGERGGKIVATAKTEVFSKLESLSYANNKIGTAGCVHLAKAKLPTLRSLDLSRNEVGSDGPAALGGGTPRLAPAPPVKPSESVNDSVNDPLAAASRRLASAAAARSRARCSRRSRSPSAPPWCSWCGR